MRHRRDGLARGDYGEYDIVIAYMNNEIYGESPYSQVGSEGIGGVVKDWDQGGMMKVKVINFDRHVHYYRNVDFGVSLIEENADAFGNGAFSFERFSPKPSYGVPKVAEMQWRTGWGYVPHMGILQQDGLFPRESDRENLTPLLGQLGDKHETRPVAMLKIERLVRRINGRRFFYVGFVGAVGRHCGGDDVRAGHG